MVDNADLSRQSFVDFARFIGCERVEVPSNTPWERSTRSRMVRVLVKGGPRSSWGLRKRCLLLDLDVGAAGGARQEEALARQRRFVADASHELRTPLTSISGYAALLERKGLQDERIARTSVKAIRQSSRRIEHLVENLLCLAGGDEGAPLELRYQDLGTVAAEAVPMAQAAAQRKVAIRYVPPAGPVRANFDRTRIEQALAILLDNAVKYTPQRGKVTVSVGEHAGWVNLEVSDTGVGIPEDQIPSIFERFYRADEARNTAGAGLGLSIAWQIAEAHGGTITVESKPDQGSTFVLRLPAGEEPKGGSGARP